METDIVYDIEQIGTMWHVTMNDIKIDPGFRHSEVADVFRKCLIGGGRQSICDAMEQIENKAFRLQNEGR